MKSTIHKPSDMDKFSFHFELWYDHFLYEMKETYDWTGQECQERELRYEVRELYDEGLTVDDVAYLMDEKYTEFDATLDNNFAEIPEGDDYYAFLEITYSKN